MKERAGAAKDTFLEETVALEAGARATLTLEAARAKDIVIADCAIVATPIAVNQIPTTGHAPRKK